MFLCVLLLVDVDFASEDVRLALHFKGDGHRRDARLQFLRQRGLVFASSVRLHVDFLATDFQLQLGAFDRAVVVEPVHVDGQLLAVHHAHEFECFGDG